jgi:hypothetical protein
MMEAAIGRLFYFAQTPVNTSALPSTAATSGEIGTILDIVFTLTGSIALLIITIAGFRYIISRGDPSATAQAKDAILYAVIGLVISIAAYSIVTYAVKAT